MPERDPRQTPAESKRPTRPAPFWEENRPLVLIADPDPQAPGALLQFCTDNGIRTLTEESGAGALISFGRNRPDVVVLSDMLADVPWRTVATAIAANGTSPVVLVHGALATLTSPGSQELPAETTAGYGQAIESAALSGLLRRVDGPSPRDAELVYGSLVMRPAAFDVRDGGHPVLLTLREFELLRILMLAQGQVVTLEQLESDVLGAIGETIKPNTLKVHLARLRHKLRGTVRPVSVRGIGYRLTVL